MAGYSHSKFNQCFKIDNFCAVIHWILTEHPHLLCGDITLCISFCIYTVKHPYDDDDDDDIVI